MTRDLHLRLNVAPSLLKLDESKNSDNDMLL